MFKQIVLSLICFAIVFLTFAEKGDDVIDSINNLLVQGGDTQKVKLMNKLGEEYLEIDLETAESIFLRSLFLSDSINYAKGVADAKKNLADIAIDKGEYFVAENYLNACIISYNKLGQKYDLGLCLNNMAIIHNRKGHFDKALSYSSYALQSFREIKNLQGIARSYNTLGIIYDNMKDYNHAILYYQKELEIFSINNDQEGLARVYINIAIVYVKTGRSDEAVILLQKSILIGENYGFPVIMATAYGNMAVIHTNVGDYETALAYHLKSYEIKQKNANPFSLMISEINIAYNYFYLKQNINAIQYLSKAINTGKELGLKLELIEAYALLAAIYESQGDYKNAYKAKVDQLVYVDSLYGVDQQVKMAEVRLDIRQSQLEAENRLLRQKSIIEKLENENAKFYRVILIVGLSLAIIFVFLLLHQVSGRRRKNKKLTELNDKMSIVNIQMKKSEFKLKESNFAKDQFFSIISHDLRNPLASMVSFVRILKRDYETFSESERDELIEEFSSVVGRTNDLLENLLLWSRSQTGKLSYNASSISAASLIKENIDLVDTSAKAKGIDLKFIDNEDDTEVLADVNMINTVLRNLLTNAVKFTLRNGVVQVGFYRGEKSCTFFIKDSGIGLEPSKLKQLFNLGQQHVRSGTENEKGSGLGLVLCKEFVEKNNGKIWAESVAGDGATFYFTLPIPSEISDSVES